MPPPPHRDDDAVVARLRAGDEAAFEALFHAEYGPLCSFAARMLGTNAAAEETVQGVFLKMWTSRARLPAITSVRAFLYKATRNAALDQLKRSAVEGRYRDEVSFDDSADVEPAPDALTQLESRESADALRAAIERLSPRARQVVTLRWGREMKHQDIADVLGISVKGVEIQITRALQTLRRYLAPR